MEGKSMLSRIGMENTEGGGREDGCREKVGC